MVWRNNQYRQQVDISRHNYKIPRHKPLSAMQFRLNDAPLQVYFIFYGAVQLLYRPKLIIIEVVSKLCLLLLRGHLLLILLLSLTT